MLKLILFCNLWEHYVCVHLRTFLGNHVFSLIKTLRILCWISWFILTFGQCFPLRQIFNRILLLQFVTMKFVTIIVELVWSFLGTRKTFVQILSCLSLFPKELVLGWLWVGYGLQVAVKSFWALLLLEYGSWNDIRLALLLQKGFELLWGCLLTWDLLFHYLVIQNVIWSDPSAWVGKSRSRRWQ